jgi:hypothetical protein
MTRSRSKAGHPAPSSQRVTELLKQQEGSGLSIAAFARQHGLRPWRLYQANQARRRTQDSHFVEVSMDPAWSPPPSPSLEVVMPGGLCIRVPMEFDESMLKRLLGVLGSC